MVTEYVSMNLLTDKRLDEDGDQACHHLEYLKSIFFRQTIGEIILSND